MQTVDKAFELLSFFSETESEFGLSELSRRADFDKATTRRLLLALAKHGHIEQNPDNRCYRIGPGVLRLARVREATIPMLAIVEPVLAELSEATGETSHFSLLSGHNLHTVAKIESSRSNRVHMAQGEPLPLHATASGLCVLAFSGEDLRSSAVRRGFHAHTAETPSTPAELEVILAEARSDGFVINRGFYERDVCSIAVPVMDHAGKAIGAIAVAAPSTRFARAEQKKMKAALIDAAAKIHSMTGALNPLRTGTDS